MGANISRVSYNSECGLTMNKLFNKAIEFYKLAGMFDDPDIGDKEKEHLIQQYKTELKTLPTKTLKEVGSFIWMWYSEPIFEFDKVMTILAEKMLEKHPNYYNVVQNYVELVGTIYLSWHQKIDAFVAKYYIDHATEINIVSYKVLEGIILLPPEYLRKAQAAILKKISDDFNSEHSVYNSNAIAELEGLYNTSTKFPKSFLEQFAKHLGPEVYAMLMRNTQRTNHTYVNEMKRIHDKEKLSLHDIVELVVMVAYGKNEFTGPMLQDWLTRTDQRGKDYLRSFLYTVELYRENFRFMLDDEYKPINDDYKNIPWPSGKFYIATWSNMPEEEQIKWGKIFADFKVVPRTSI